VKLTVLYFARLREAIGRPREEWSVPSDVTNLGQLREWLIEQGEPWSRAFGGVPRVRAAVDQVMAGDAAPLRDGAEVAFFPPVTGG
jgi:sulfur-carrier protein